MLGRLTVGSKARRVNETGPSAIDSDTARRLRRKREIAASHPSMLGIVWRHWWKCWHNSALQGLDPPFDLHICSCFYLVHVHMYWCGESSWDTCVAVAARLTSRMSAALRFGSICQLLRSVCIRRLRPPLRPHDCALTSRCEEVIVI